MGNLKSLAILLVISQMGMMSLQARAGFHKIPDNCAVEQSKLTELAKYARQIPQGFDKNIFGRWYAQKFLVGDVKVDVKKDKRGEFLVGLDVEAPALGINIKETQPLMICTTNNSTFKAVSNLQGQRQELDIEVQSNQKIKILNGRLSGLYKKILTEKGL